MALFGVAVTDTAAAAQVWPSACLNDAAVKTTFNAGDQVCASGDVDHVPPGEICGAGDLYVIPKDNPNPFADVTLGGANYFTTCLGGGGFIDQSMWLPPLKPGEYEIVLDQTPFFDPDNAGFDPTRDIRGVYFTVSNAPIVLSCNPAAIKAAAAQAAADAAMIEKTVKLIEAIQLLESLVSAETPAGIAYTLFCKALGDLESPVGCPQQIWDWTQGKALELLANLGKALEHMYSDIAADPPDADYLEMVPITMSDPLLADKPWASPLDAELTNRTAMTAQHLAIQTSAYRAFLPSFEKEQGAQQANDHLGLVLQTEKMIAYLELVEDSAAAIAAEADAIVGLAADEPSGDGAAWQAVLDDFVANGFTEEQESFLRSFGADDAAIAEAAQLLNDFATDLTLPPTVGYASLAARLKSQHETMAAAVADLKSQAIAVRDENEPYALRTHPDVSIAAPAPGAVGTPTSLTATATHFDAMATITYAWDTDLDGVYDDGNGPNAQLVPLAGGRHVVSVRATDDAGRADVAFAIVEATPTNAPPRITAMNPAGPAPFAEVGETIDLHVEAEDSDGDPLTITWWIDGVEVATGPDHAWSMPDELAHTVEVVIADDDPYSPDAGAGLVVRAAKWDGMTGEGAGGAGGAGGSSGASGGNDGASGGAGATGDDGGGCGCAVVGGGRGAAGWLALLGLGVLLERRRRRRGLPEARG